MSFAHKLEHVVAAVTAIAIVAFMSGVAYERSASADSRSAIAVGCTQRQ